MTKDPKIAVVERQIEAWNTMDWDAACALIADDAILQSMMFEPLRGKAEVEGRIRVLAEGTESCTLDVQNIGRVGDVVMVERVDRFVYKGNPGAIPVVGVFEVEDDKITVWREYYDRAAFVRELGLEKDFIDTGDDD